MYLEFEQLPNNAKVWVYQSNKKLSQNQINIISYRLKNEIAQWEAHGNPLQGSFNLIDDIFLIIAVDEAFNAPSGCSIDSSVKWIKELNNELDIDFFDRSFYYLDNQNWQNCSMFKVKELIKESVLKPDSLVINQKIMNKSQLLKDFKIPANQHPFYGQYFVKENN